MALVVHIAPVPGTVDDFWQMIWDQRINMVIMLTRTVEGGKVCVHMTCTHTWTQNGSLQTLCRARVRTTTQSLLVIPSAVAGFRYEPSPSSTMWTMKYECSKWYR